MRSRGSRSDGAKTPSSWTSGLHCKRRPRFPGALDRVVRLMSHPAFDVANPNRVRALVHSFCQGNPVRFHAADGSGYRFWEDRMREIDPLNPEVASRLASVMAHWRRYDDTRRDRMGAAMEAVLAMPGISKNTNEVLARILKPLP